jgi:2-iminobutanoate/2-iminopropanoate deaminase
MAKEVISTQKAPAPAGAYSQAVKANGLIFVSGQLPIDMSTGILNSEGVHKETRIIMDNISAILEAAGSSLANTVKLSVFLIKIDDIKFVNEVLTERFGANLPARTTIEASSLPKGAKVEIDAIATE